MRRKRFEIPAGSLILAERAKRQNPEPRAHISGAVVSGGSTRGVREFYDSIFSQFPVVAERKIASITVILLIASSSGIGWSCCSRIDWENNDP
jgi:hypothetical protein